MREMLKNVINAHRATDSYKREQIRCGDHAAFVLLVGAMLDESVNRDGEEAGGKSQSGEQNQNVMEGEIVSGEQNPKNRHADRAQRDEAILHLAARKIACRKAAHAYADGDCGLKNAGASRGGMQNIAAIKNDVGGEQRAQKPEIGA